MCFAYMLMLNLQIFLNINKNIVIRSCRFHVCFLQLKSPILLLNLNFLALFKFLAFKQVRYSNVTFLSQCVCMKLVSVCARVRECVRICAHMRARVCVRISRFRCSIGKQRKQFFLKFFVQFFRIIYNLDNRLYILVKLYLFLEKKLALQYDYLLIFVKYEACVIQYMKFSTQVRKNIYIFFFYLLRLKKNK